MANSQISNIAPIFGEILRCHRAEQGISQEELAFRAGIDRTFVSRLERGLKQPTLTTLIGLAGALGFSAADLVRETEERYLHGSSSNLGDKT
ncbi:helix-turn-helix domain-containing protein [Collimonas pratensis]|uniref:helix-turn-helix domain-containing protein n=1 Tax=Collimonas pratensis TaxID=279113 RepID=UPI0009ECDABB